MARHTRTEAGVATVLVLVLAFLLIVVAGGSATGVALVIAHRTAQNAADLAALAGAQAVALGREPCVAAGGVASADHATLVDCSVEGSAVAVEVEVTSAFGLRRKLHAKARAGP